MGGALWPYSKIDARRALEDWPAIDFDDDRDGNLFTATVHRRAIEAVETSDASSEPQKGSQKNSQKSSQKTIEIMRTAPTITIADLAVQVGISDRAVKKQIEKLKAQNRIRRIGPDKGGYWEVIG